MSNSHRQRKKLAEKKVPKTLEKIVSQEDFARANAYSLDKSRFSTVTSTFSLAQLIAIFVLFVAGNVFGWNFSLSAPSFQPTAYVTDLVGSGDQPANPVAIMSVAFIAIVTVFVAMLIGQSGQRWSRQRPHRAWGTEP